MNRLEVFFDYACPFCLRAHEYLKELLPLYPEIEVVWRPCEAHPRPDRYGPHSDLCIQGMFFAKEQGADLWAYHERMYAAALKGGADIEKADELSACVEGLLEADAFRKALLFGRHVIALQDANRYAYGQSGVWVVPAYRLNGQKLDAIENIGVTKEELGEFLEKSKT